MISRVVMDIAAFKVSHPVGPDCNATALRAARARSSSIRAMERYVRGFGTQTLTCCDVKNTRTTVSARVSSRGRWRKAHGQFKRRAHIVSLIGVHVAVGQRCRAVDEESPALPNMSMRNVPAGRWNVTRYTRVRFAWKLTSCHKAHVQRSVFIGAMEEMRQKVQNANTHILRCHRHEHTHNSWSVQGQVQWGDGTLHVGSIRGKAHPLPHNAHSNCQHTSGAMERYTKGEHAPMLQSWSRCLS